MSCLWTRVCVILPLAAATQEAASLRMHSHCAALAAQANAPAPDSSVSPPMYWMTRWDPTWSCTVDTKIGHSYSSGDGGKWYAAWHVPLRCARSSLHILCDRVCDAHVLNRPGCLVYSLGSLGDYAFDKALAADHGCEIHVFDPFNFGIPPDPERTRIHHHPWGVDAYSHERVVAEKPVTLLSLADMAARLGHRKRRIDVLKIDVEGCEMGVLDNATVWAALDAQGTTFDQILVEVHFEGVSKVNYKFKPKTAEYSVAQMEGLFSTLTERGYAVFHKEPNLFSRGTACAEFGLVRVGVDCSAQPHVASDTANPYVFPHHLHHGGGKNSGNR